MTKEQIFDKIDDIYCDADGGVIQLGANRENQIKEIIETAINFTRCCTELVCEKCDNSGWIWSKLYANNVKCDCGK